MPNNKRDRFRTRPTCPRMDCPFNHADSIPTQAIILDMFTDKDKKHIEKYHHSCYVTLNNCFYTTFHLYCVYTVHQRVKQLENEKEKKKNEQSM